MAAELEGANLERDPGSGRALGEDHRQRLAGERLLPVVAALHPGGQIENGEELGFGEVRDREEMPGSVHRPGGIVAEPEGDGNVLPVPTIKNVTCSKAHPLHALHRRVILSRAIRVHRWLSVASLCLATSPAAAQQVTVVRAARMLDVAKGEMISPAVVVVANGKIQSVGA